MVLPQSVVLTNGDKAIVRELKVSEAMAILTALDASDGGLDEFIFVRTDELVPLAGESIALGNATVNDLTFSDLDGIAVAFTEVNKSFLARVIAKRKKRGDPLPDPSFSLNPTNPDPSPDLEPVTSTEPASSSSNEAI